MAKKLYELLVVKGQLDAQSATTRSDLKKTFADKKHLFQEKLVTFHPLADGARPVVEAQSDIQSTIERELRWFAGIVSKAWDTGYQVAEGNMTARADVILDDGAVLLRDIPALALLELNKRVGELFELVKAAPTLDPAQGFKLDPDRGEHIYKAREVSKNRTAKVQKVIVLYEATTEHPAQTQLVSVDEPTGRIQEQEWSAMITPARKSLLLSRIEEVRRAITQAMQRANEVRMPETLPTVADTIFNFVLKP